MYDLLETIIGYNLSGTSYQSYLIYGCIVLICVFSAVVIDLLYRLFSHFWH